MQWFNEPERYEITDGYTVLSEPRTTGDGCFESAVTAPKGNYVEITV